MYGPAYHDTRKAMIYTKLSGKYGEMSKHAQKWASIPLNEQAYLRVDSDVFSERVSSKRMELA